MDERDQITEELNRAINIEQIRTAQATLDKYKQGKANLDKKLIDNEDWWKLTHERNFKKLSYLKDEATGKIIPVSDHLQIKRQSAWLFNSIMNKHADAMDNFPEPAILPREQSDEAAAKTLSSIIPVVLDNADFEQTYSDLWWDKLINGAAIYAVTWDQNKQNGLGDISIDPVDMLNFYWEPGIQDIQDSRNLFVLTLVDNDVLESTYPELKGKLLGNGIDVKKYNYDDQVDTTNKSVVVDWYYKLQNGPKTALQFVKFVGDNVLYSSEDDMEHPEYKQEGFYSHGKYPFVVDLLFREKGTPCGFGYIDVMRSPQEYIDDLGADLLENAKWASKPRFFSRDDNGINEEEFKDIDRQVVHVAGSLDDTHIKPIQVNTISGNYLNILQSKIDELKETSGNRDFSQGATSSGVTAASAIAALQEAGSKGSRDMIKGAYRAYSEIVKLVIELMRQFYDLPRVFRITGENGRREFVSFDNGPLQMQPTEVMGQVFMSMPEFDISVKAQRSNPYSKLSQNELALQFYQLGFFNPQQATQALACVELMDFDGKEKLKEMLQQNNNQQQIMLQMAQMIGELTGDNRIAEALLGQPLTQPQAPIDAGKMNETDAYGQPVGDSNSIGDKAKEESRKASQVK